MFSGVSFRRELTRDDLERMRVPSRYWMSSFDQLSSDGGGESIKGMVHRYISNMSDMRRAGGGFVFWGGNGTGKTSGSVVIAKEYRRRGETVLFLEAASIKKMVIEKEHFDEDQTYWDRAMSVDVLVVDDFGKGVMDGTGLGATLVDELIRHRNSNRRVTIITTNLDPAEWIGELGLKESTMKTLKECAIPVHVTGEDKRDCSADMLRSMLAN